MQRFQYFQLIDAMPHHVTRKGEAKCYWVTISSFLYFSLLKNINIFTSDTIMVIKITDQFFFLKNK